MLAPVSVDTIDLALHTVLAEAIAVVVRRQDACALVDHHKGVIELDRLAWMPEAPTAPRVWRGCLSKLCAPREGLPGDQIAE